MRHESKFVVSCVWGAGGIRLSRNDLSGRLHPVCDFGEAGLDSLSGVASTRFFVHPKARYLNLFLIVPSRFHRTSSEAF